MPNDDSKPTIEQIVSATTLYRLLLPELVRRVWLADKTEVAGTKDATAILNRLTRKRRGEPPLLDSHKFPKTSHRYFTLHGATPAPDAVEFDLATAWFCLGTDTRRHRLESRELKVLFGKQAPHHHIRHAISDANHPGGPTLYRIYPTTTTSKNTVGHLRKRHLVDGKRKLPQWVKDGEYAVAILVDTDSKKQEIEDEVHRVPKVGDSLISQCSILVEKVPTTRSIGEWL